MPSARLSKHQLIQICISFLYQDFGQDACSLTYATQLHLWFTGCLHPSVYLRTVWYVADEKTIKGLQAASWKDCSLQRLNFVLQTAQTEIPVSSSDWCGGRGINHAANKERFL